MFFQSRAMAQALILATISAECVLANINIAVVNPSFEILPQGGLNFSDCAVTTLNCSYSNGLTIPGWMTTGTAAYIGQFQPGTLGSTHYFTTLSDGLTSAYSTAGGQIAQTVTATAQAGITYSLFVDLGRRNDADFLGTASLVIGSNTILATGLAPTPGNWSTFVASYTASLADNGAPIQILLNSSGQQGNYDNVVLSATPEPGFYAVLAIGLSGLAFARRRVVKN